MLFSSCEQLLCFLLCVALWDKSENKKPGYSETSVYMHCSNLVSVKSVFMQQLISTLDLILASFSDSRSCFLVCFFCLDFTNSQIFRVSFVFLFSCFECKDASQCVMICTFILLPEVFVLLMFACKKTI